MNKNLSGNAWTFGNDINTDLIIPARYLNTTDHQELAAHLMEDVDPNFIKKISNSIWSQIYFTYVGSTLAFLVL